MESSLQQCQMVNKSSHFCIAYKYLLWILLRLTSNDVCHNGFILWLTTFGNVKPFERNIPSAKCECRADQLYSSMYTNRNRAHYQQEMKEATNKNESWQCRMQLLGLSSHQVKSSLEDVTCIRSWHLTAIHCQLLRGRKNCVWTASRGHLMDAVEYPVSAPLSDVSVHKPVLVRMEAALLMEQEQKQKGAMHSVCPEQRAKVPKYQNQWLLLLSCKKASVGLCLAAHHTLDGISGADSPIPPEPPIPMGLLHPWVPGWSTAIRCGARSAAGRAWDVGNVVSTRLAKECSVYKTMAF